MSDTKKPEGPENTSPGTDGHMVQSLMDEMTEDEASKSADNTDVSDGPAPPPIPSDTEDLEEDDESTKAMEAPDFDDEDDYNEDDEKTISADPIAVAPTLANENLSTLESPTIANAPVLDTDPGEDEELREELSELREEPRLEAPVDSAEATESPESAEPPSAEKTMMLDISGGLSPEQQVPRGRIRILHGNDTGEVIDLPVGTYTVGRHEEAEITLSDPAISREHFRLIVSDTGSRLEDLGSGNGTKVNGIRTPDALLEHGVQIEAGTSVLRYEDPMRPDSSFAGGSSDSLPTQGMQPIINVAAPKRSPLVYVVSALFIVFLGGAFVAGEMLFGFYNIMDMSPQARKERRIEKANMKEAASVVDAVEERFKAGKLTNTNVSELLADLEQAVRLDPREPRIPPLGRKLQRLEEALEEIPIHIEAQEWTNAKISAKKALKLDRKNVAALKQFQDADTEEKRRQIVDEANTLAEGGALPEHIVAQLEKIPESSTYHVRAGFILLKAKKASEQELLTKFQEAKRKRKISVAGELVKLLKRDHPGSPYIAQAQKDVEELERKIEERRRRRRAARANAARKRKERASLLRTDSIESSVAVRPTRTEPKPTPPKSKPEKIVVTAPVIAPTPAPVVTPTPEPVKEAEVVVETKPMVEPTPAREVVPLPTPASANNIKGDLATGKSLYQRGEYDQAIDYFERLSTSTRVRDSVRRKAQKAATDVAKYRSNFTEGKKALANYQSRKAIQRLNTARKADKRLGGTNASIVNPLLAKAYIRAAQEQMTRKEYGRATTYVRRAQALDPTNPEASSLNQILLPKASKMLQDAIAARDNGDKDKARRLLQQVLEMVPEDDPNYEKAYKILSRL
ncbi:MAG: hypothetical protein CMH54_07525 [Myxococcales bacterium]|nr:hypothetical protein [Myxococcales bacterium]